MENWSPSGGYRRGTMYVAVAVWTAGVLLSGSARADEAEGARSSWFAVVGAEGWVGEQSGWHGVGLAHWRWRSVESRWRLDLQFNTDTLRLSGSGPLPLAGLRFYGELAGEYPFAGLLPDYYRRGRRVPGRGFSAGYGAGTAGLRYARGGHFVRLEATVRRWFFDRSPATDPDLVLPAETWAVEPALRYTFWGVEPDPSQWEPHQLFRRLEGVAAGFSLRADLRSRVEPWGARGAAFRPPDPRNVPRRPILTARQWAAGGVDLEGPWRFQWGEQLRWGFGEDDLSRDRLGGVNPYSIRIAGLPWAALVSGRYAAAHAAIRWTGWADHEVGLFADAAAVADPRRVGDTGRFGPASGGGLLVDLRFGPWKADARLGASLPVAWLEARPLFDGWISVGRRW